MSEEPLDAGGRELRRDDFCGCGQVWCDFEGGTGLSVQGFGSRVSSLGFRVSGLGSRISGIGFRLSGLGCGI